MPELPEVQGLVDFLRTRAVGRFITRVDISAVNVLKTFDPPVSALAGSPVTDVTRHGKWIDLTVDGTHLVAHLSKAGWLRWSDAVSDKPLRPTKGPIALRVVLDDGAGFDLTEAGTRKRLAVYVVTDPQQVPPIATLGPDPLAAEFDRAAFAALLRDRRAQIKGVLRDQSILAGVGNAYSDEILHVAKMSPFALASSLTETQVDVLYGALRDVLITAVQVPSGRPAVELKDAKRSGMRVHGRAGNECPVCGDTVREVSFASSSLQYCPTCQTGGKLLADRRMSRLLR
ncbi:MAG: Fpg/Nei family DNA glycosylase [Actinomycetota bacterium]